MDQIYKPYLNFDENASMNQQALKYRLQSKEPYLQKRINVL